MTKKLVKIAKKSNKIAIDDSTKLVIMSDCHRGAGDYYDNFLKNQNIFETALHYYYNNDFTYIELGDGDDMWEVKNYKDIINTYLDIFKLLKKFYTSNRLLMLYGNHDIVKKYPAILKRYFYKYYDAIKKQEDSLLEGIVIYESLILNYKNKDILLIHGHQVDFLNSILWRLSRFLVRHIWKTLERLGFKDLTGSLKNNIPKSRSEKKLKKWSIKNNKMVIAGHTHRPIFPKAGQSIYFNVGSCIHLNGISCLEIENGKITLVKWAFKVNKNNVIVIKRSLVDSSEPIINYFK